MKGTKGAEVIPQLKPEKGDYIIEKRAYSGFFETGLDSLLRSLNVNAFERADREGLQFIGLFHSHPAPANPTTTDLQYMKLWPYAIWLILSATTNGIAAFQMTNDKVQKVALKIE